ncbi:MAG: hypothetical protein ACFFC7_02470 [Candidatus Hermodarchaeota archaeon]
MDPTETIRIFSSVTFGDHWGTPKILQGPIKTTELEHIYVYPFNLKDPQSNDIRIRKFGRLSIFLLHVRKDTEEAELFSKQKETINDKLTDLISEITISDYCYTVINSAKVCEHIKNNLAHFLSLRAKASHWGASLYNIGTIFQLPENMQVIAKTLMQKERSLEELKKIHPELQEKLVGILNDMIDLGYVHKTSQDYYAAR